jgi:restriction system protein
MSGPQFIRYFPHVIDALKELGNSGTPSEVRNIIARKLSLSDDDLNEQMESGSSRFENQVAWCRFYLTKTGHIDSSKRGVWSLTDKGLNSRITEKEAHKIYQEAQSRFRGKTSLPSSTTDVEESIAPTTTSISPVTDYRAEVLELIRSLPPAGFEKLCQRLLRESGFQQVVVTGRSGDGGIDGRGLLEINRLMSIPVVFQSKRYAAGTSVTVSQIRDLRGAMAGRTDKGIFITTSNFTVDAKKEALREGVPPIELVDGQKLISMLEDLELGLIPKKVYDIDVEFFNDFR